MFAKSHRFHGYGSLKAVYARGNNVRGSLLSLKFSNRNQDRPYRVAVVVSRKVSKSAVVRNRIRRRIYEQVRANSACITPGMDMVFTVYNEQLATLETPKLFEAVEELVKKAARYK